MKNVTSVNDALLANMKDKSYLNELILNWANMNYLDELVHGRKFGLGTNGGIILQQHDATSDDILNKL